MAFRIVRELIGNRWVTKAEDESEGGTVTPGTVVPVADPAGATVDDTTYDNSWTGSGKFTTLVFPQDTGAIVIAREGDAFPRIVMLSNPEDGFFYGDGTVDPVNDGAAWWINGPDENGHFSQVIEGGRSGTQRAEFGQLDANAGYRTHFNAGIAVTADVITAGAVTISSGGGVPVIGGNVGDVYIRADGGDGTWIYRCTVAGPAGAATWVAKL